jgi:pyridoxal phosphate enzyme (YggS family)
MDYINEQYHSILNNIRELELKYGRKENSVKLIAVSKTFPVENIEVVYQAGQRLFAENKVQELENKVNKLPNDIIWHLIGHLQSNKVIKAVTLSSYIHSVDSEKLLKRIDRISGEQSVKPKIFFEVNISGEESKFGLSPIETVDLTNFYIENCKNVELCGLMTMAPHEATNDELDDVFGGLAELKKNIEIKYNITLPELSMGMSSDYEAAIRNGATFLRIGSSIFGKRNYQ